MTHNVFVYGSLLADEVVHSLLNRVPKTQTAVVRGYSRHSIKERIYPAAVKSSAAEQLEGRVLLDLTDKELQILDDFEDDDYYRAIVPAELAVGGKVDAAMYVWQDAFRSILYGTWDYEHFRKENLQDFLRMMGEWESSASFPKEVS